MLFQNSRQSDHILNTIPGLDIDIQYAEGVYLHDENGKRYIDFESGIWCAALGHNHARVNAALVDQLNKITHLGPRFRSQIVEEAAVKLLELTPLRDGKVVFLSSGSEAVELGIRLSLEYTGRNSLLCLSGSYLGAYGNAAMKSATVSWDMVDISPCYKCRRQECEIYCSNLTAIDFSKTAAFVLEPVIVSAGIYIPPYKPVKFLAQQVQRYGGVIIVDEVTTGLGRTGKWLGIELFDIDADIICFGKALGNGYPVSAVTIRSDIAISIESKGIRYVQSHQNDPLGCSVALKVLNVMKEEDLISKSFHIGKVLNGYLKEIKGKSTLIKDVRGLGLVQAIELGDISEEGYLKIYKEMINRGYILGIKPEKLIFRFLPPLIIEEEHISGMYEELVDILHKSI